MKKFLFVAASLLIACSANAMHVSSAGGGQTLTADDSTIQIQSNTIKLKPLSGNGKFLLYDGGWTEYEWPQGLGLSDSPIFTGLTLQGQTNGILISDVDGIVYASNAQAKTNLGIGAVLNQGIADLPSNQNISAIDSGGHYSNKSATSMRGFLASSTTPGTRFTFLVADSDGLRVTVANGQKIFDMDGILSQENGYLESTTVGASITIELVELSDNTLRWFVTSRAHSWVLH